MQLDILTPDSKVFSGEITSVTVPGIQGMFQVLYNHAPIISTLGKGTIKVDAFVKDEDSEREEQKELVFNAEGGVVEVLKNKIIILVEKIAEAQPAEA
ncbi:MAG: hypothetical protein AAF570_16455 [Bacteroidota bacterium]